MNKFEIDFIDGQSIEIQNNSSLSELAYEKGCVVVKDYTVEGDEIIINFDNVKYIQRVFGDKE